ncbi:hypothetical protein KFU94_09970 [Chloroflexi bacterium TSY]|nr:hypothetical protein [Chloroflexi bacterium TSY]
MEPTSFKIGWILLIIFYALGAVTGVSVVFSPMTFIGAEIEAYSDTSLAEFTATYGTCHEYLLIEILEQGIFMFASYVIPLLILIFAFRKKEKWAWFAILASWIINAFATIGGNLPTGEMNVVYMSAVFAVLGFVALGITAQPLWQSSDQE